MPFIDGATLTFPSACVYVALPVAWLAIFLQDPRGFERLGLQVTKWADQPTKLLTHCLVHGSDAHLLGTVTGFISSAAVWLAMQSSSSTAAAYQAPLLDAVAAVGSAIVSGVVGGVGATLFGLYVERLKFIEDHKWGHHVVDNLVSKGFKALRENRIVVCGGSAVVNGFAGFVFGAHDKPLNLVITIAVDCVALGLSYTHKTTWGSLLGFSDVGNAVSSVVPDTNNGGAGVSEFFSNIANAFTGAGGVGNATATTASGKTEFAVGHAAHIGGALMGYAMGMAFREIRHALYVRHMANERDAARRRRHRGGGGGGGEGSGRRYYSDTLLRSHNNGGGAAPSSSGGRRLGAWTRASDESASSSAMHNDSSFSPSARQRSRSAEMGGNPFRRAMLTSASPQITARADANGGALTRTGSTETIPHNASPAANGGRRGSSSQNSSRFHSDFDDDDDDGFERVPLPVGPMEHATAMMARGGSSLLGGSADDTVAYFENTSAYMSAGPTPRDFGSMSPRGAMPFSPPSVGGGGGMFAGGGARGGGYASHSSADFSSLSSNGGDMAMRGPEAADTPTLTTTSRIVGGAAGGLGALMSSAVAAVTGGSTSASHQVGDSTMTVSSRASVEPAADVDDASRRQRREAMGGDPFLATNTSQSPRYR